MVFADKKLSTMRRKSDDLFSFGQEEVKSIYSEHRLNLVLEGQRIVSRCVVSDNLAILINEELCEIPGNDFCLILVGVKQRALDPQESVDWVRVSPIDVDLGEHWELYVVGTLRKGLNPGLCAWLLLLKLVARECKDLESLLAILLVKLNHLLVVHVRQASVSRNVDHHRALFTSNQVSQLRYLLSINVFCTNLM